MAKKVGRLKPQEIQRRVLELETLYGQKNLANKLGVSADTIRRYRSGKSSPNTKSIYSKLNNLYNKNRNSIDQGAVKRKQELIAKRSQSQRQGKRRTRYVPIDPDYMYYSPAEQFRSVRNWERLERMQEEGYVAGYVGGNDIPLEVQFVIHGESLRRWGVVINIMGIVTTEISPKAENGYTGESTSLNVYPTAYRIIRGLRKTDSYETKMDKIREFFYEDLKIDRGHTVAFLGFYFRETDEVENDEYEDEE